MDKKKDLIIFESSSSDGEGDANCGKTLFDGTSIVKVGIHNGKFTLGDVLACVITKINFDKIIVTRSRDQDVLDTCDVIFGVGGMYDPEHYKFDRHQKNFDVKFDAASNILLSSAGIAWKVFGKSLITKWLGELKTNPVKENPRFIEEVFISIYYKYIFEIDAIEGGVPRLKNEAESLLTENYSFEMNLSDIILNYNSLYVENDDEQLKSFNNAMQTVEDIFVISAKKLIVEKIEFFNYDSDFQNKYDDPTKLPEILDVTDWINSYTQLLSKFF